MNEMVIPFAEAAYTYCDTTDVAGKDFVTFTVVGLLVAEVVTVEVPRVVVANQATDAHWTPLLQEDSIVQLRAGHNSITVPTDLVIRMKKPLSTGNAFGVRRS